MRKRSPTLCANISLDTITDTIPYEMALEAAAFSQ